MATVTYGDILNSVAVAAGLNPSSTAGTADLSEVDKYALVNIINGALRWVWHTDDPLWAWPSTVSVNRNVVISQGAQTVNIVSGGTGYAVNDVLSIVGGTSSTTATVTVAAVSGGVVTRVYVSNQGDYSVIPTGTISVTGGGGSSFTCTINWTGYIPLANVSSTTNWVSLWESDPRQFTPSTPTNVTISAQDSCRPVPVTWDGSQFNVWSTSATSPVFAFYRQVCPSATWSAGASYSTPTIPAEFQDIVVSKALSDYLDIKRVKDDGDITEIRCQVWMEGRKAAIANTQTLPWRNNVVAI